MIGSSSPARAAAFSKSWLANSRVDFWARAFFQKPFFDPRRLLLPHFPLEKHLQGVFAGFPAERHLAAFPARRGFSAARSIRRAKLLR